jgi:hypothetical protein
MRFSISAVAAVMGSALFAASTHAAVIGYTGTGATAGTNSGNLNIGRQFSVTGTGITLRDLGVWDSGGDGLVNSHAVQLFTITSGAGAANATVSPVAGGGVTVPSGTAAPLDTGFRFTSLASGIFLAPGNYSVVVYGLNVTGGDPFGNGGGFPANGNVSDIRFDPFQFTAAASPSYPTQGDTNNHSGASFRYELGNTVPEPAGLIGFVVAAAGGLLARRRGHCAKRE